MTYTKTPIKHPTGFRFAVHNAQTHEAINFLQFMTYLKDDNRDIIKEFITVLRDEVDYNAYFFETPAVKRNLEDGEKTTFQFALLDAPSLGIPYIY